MQQNVKTSSKSDREIVCEQLEVMTFLSQSQKFTTNSLVFQMILVFEKMCVIWMTINVFQSQSSKYSGFLVSVGKRLLKNIRLKPKRSM